MIPKRMIAIDPGANGAISYETGNPKIPIAVEKMPQTLHDLVDKLHDLSLYCAEVFVYVEKVGGYMPGNSGPAAVKFGRHVGNLEGILAALKIPFDWITPSKWEHALIGKPDYPKIPKEVQGKARKQILVKRKKERKNKIKEKVQQLNPHLEIILQTADAVGILIVATR